MNQVNVSSCPCNMCLLYISYNINLYLSPPLIAGLLLHHIHSFREVYFFKLNTNWDVSWEIKLRKSIWDVFGKSNWGNQFGMYLGNQIGMHLGNEIVDVFGKWNWYVYGKLFSAKVCVFLHWIKIKNMI